MPLKKRSTAVQDMLANPLAYAASRDPDTMYVDQALKAPDKKEFLKAMQKEVEAHTERSTGNWSPIGGTCRY